MPAPVFVTFTGGSLGAWRVERIDPIVGAGLPRVDRVLVREAAAPARPAAGAWCLSGVTSNTRYTNRPEVSTLATVQQGLDRPEARCAALIPIRKTEAWWALAQDERRAILAERSRHISIGLEYLPAVARRLLHSRELGEPFDFLTWFEFAPAHTAAFDELLRRLREREEWHFVDREVDIRLVRDDV